MQPALAVALALIALAACSRSRSSPDHTRGEDRAAPPRERFDGVVVRVLTYTGPQILEPIARHAPEFTALTGARVDITVVPFSELYQTAQSDLGRRASHYDLMVLPAQWLVDFAGDGGFEDLTDRVARTPALAWDDIAPFFRDHIATYRDRIHAIPLDGDFQMVYYRADLLEREGLAPPRTWDDYLVIAAALHGRDLDGDGQPDAGSCISKRPGAQAFWMIGSIAAPFLQSQGTAQGAFFDPETMQPLINNAAFARALDIYAATGAFGPPDERTMDVADSRALFTRGRCALTLDWGDPGTLAIAPGSRVADTIGAVILPGSRRVLDRASGRLVPCDKARCPYAVEGINYAPYAAFGGWSGSIHAASADRAKDAAFAFLVYMSEPAQSNRDVTIGASGFNPYRMSQFTDRTSWRAAGMSEEAASRYLGALGVSLRSPNMVLDLRIPHNQRYQQVVLDFALARFLARDLTRDETMETIEREWNRITDELGREAQRSAYRASLGLDRPDAAQPPAKQ